MARASPLSEDGVLHLRLAAQALHRPGRRSAADLVRHLAGVQAQVLSAAALALGARSPSLRVEAVDAARLEDRSIVLCWAMRGTLHLVAAEDHGWIVPLTVEPGRTNAQRRLKQEGVPPGQPERALRLIEVMLEREGRSPGVRSGSGCSARASTPPARRSPTWCGLPQPAEGSVTDRRRVAVSASCSRATGSASRSRSAGKRR